MSKGRFYIKEFSRMTITYATQTGDGIYEVNCSVCLNSVGTFRMRMLELAIKATVDKGGIMCSNCRPKHCVVCGTEVQKSISISRPECSSFCRLCTLNLDQGMTLSEITLCNANSRMCDCVNCENLRNNKKVSIERAIDLNRVKA
jgi:hypothetical protein